MSHLQTAFDKIQVTKPKYHIIRRTQGESFYFDIIFTYHNLTVVIGVKLETSQGFVL